MATAQTVYDSLTPMFKDYCKDNEKAREELSQKHNLSANDRIIFHQLCIHEGTYTIDPSIHSTNLKKEKIKIEKKIIKNLNINTNKTLHYKLKKMSCIKNASESATSDLTENRQSIAYLLNELDSAILDDINQSFLNKCALTADIENKIDKARKTFMINNTKELYELDVDKFILKSVNNNKCNEIDKLCNNFERFYKSYNKYLPKLREQLQIVKKAFVDLSIGKWNANTNQWEEDLVHKYWSFEHSRTKSVVLNSDLFEYLYAVHQKVKDYQSEATKYKNKIDKQRKNIRYKKELKSMDEQKRAARERKRNKTRNKTPKIEPKNETKNKKQSKNGIRNYFSNKKCIDDDKKKIEVMNETKKDKNELKGTKRSNSEMEILPRPPSKKRKVENIEEENFADDS
eukprot:2879_1